MSKVEAYRCDYCNEIKESEEIVAINPVEDLFNKMAGFPAVFKYMERYNIHHCMSCYNMHVVSVAERETNRRKDERGYELKLAEMYYNLRSQCVANYMKKNMANLAKSKK